MWKDLHALRYEGVLPTDPSPLPAVNLLLDVKSALLSAAEQAREAARGAAEAVPA